MSSADYSQAFKDLHVIGFHGAVDRHQTPAKQEPVYESQHGTIVSVFGKRVIDSGNDSTDEAQWTYGTKLERKYPAEPGWCVVIIGPREMDEPALRARIDELAGEAHEDLGDGCLAIHCNPRAATELLQHVSDAALHRIVTAAIADDERELENAGWWLQRAAGSNEDIYCAGAALGATGYGREMALDHVRGVSRLTITNEIGVRRPSRALT